MKAAGSSGSERLVAGADYDERFDDQGGDDDRPASLVEAALVEDPAGQALDVKLMARMIEAQTDAADHSTHLIAHRQDETADEVLVPRGAVQAEGDQPVADRVAGTGAPLRQQQPEASVRDADAERLGELLGDPEALEQGAGRGRIGATGAVVLEHGGEDRLVVVAGVKPKWPIRSLTSTTRGPISATKCRSSES